ncbi:MAG: DUF3048 domain-containing protein [Oscillospiraceae bacterium]|nr:DUF3048 domain-containing protein [Oscillospiraceae bacterium]
MGKGKHSLNKGSWFQRLKGFLLERRKIVVPAAAAVLLLAAGAVVLATVLPLNRPEPQPEAPSSSPVIPSPPPKPSPSPVKPSPSPSPETPEGPVNPLTGLALEDESALYNRPFAVMHNNSYDKNGRQNALPMHGVSQADVIYEVLAEGGITRMLALYQDLSKIPSLGAIRSTRTYYLELALAYDAILSHAGGSYQAIYQDIPRWGMDTINAERYGSTYWRDKSRIDKGTALEHTMFTSGEALLGAIEKLERKTVPEGFANGLSYSNHVTVSGEAALRVRVPFTNNKSTWFLYNREEDVYYVEEYGSAFIDGQNNQQVAVTNVLVLNTDISVIDKEGRLSVDLTSGGGGYYISGGQAAPISWSRDAYDAPFRYTGQDGKPLELRPGKAYICVIDDEPEFFEEE